MIILLWKTVQKKYFQQKLFFLKKKIANQKIVKYHKEIIVSLETEKLPVFDIYGYCPPQKNLNEFNINVINRGKKSEGISVAITGKPIENKFIEIKKVTTKLWNNSKEEIYSTCCCPEKKEINGETFLIYRLNDFEFSAGYNKEVLEKMFRANNMSLYKKALDLQYESVIRVSFECEITELKNELQVFIHPNENLKNGGTGVIMELEEIKSLF